MWWSGGGEWRWKSEEGSEELLIGSEQQWWCVYFARAACGAARFATTNISTDTRGSQTGFRATANEQGRHVAWRLVRSATGSW